MSQTQQTGQRNLLELAKQGNANAIASLINQSLQPKGMTAKVKLQQGCLYVFVESSQLPNQQAIVGFIRKGIERLEVESIKTVKIYAQQSGKDGMGWSQEFELAPQVDAKSLLLKSSPHPIYEVAKPQNGNGSLTPSPNGRYPYKGIQENIKWHKEKALSIYIQLIKYRHFERILLVFLTFVFTSIFWLQLEARELAKPKSGSNFFSGFANLLGENKTTISGAAWVTKQGGNSDIIRGLEVALCKESVSTELLEVRNKKWGEIAEKYKNRSGYWYLNINAMNQKVAAHKDCIALVKTGVEGMYTIPDVPLGSYFLYAPFETSFSKAYWLVPIKVENTKPIHIDLDNSNMKELYNRESR